jgi:hypothetical protein
VPHVEQRIADMNHDADALKYRTDCVTTRATFVTPLLQSLSKSWIVAMPIVYTRFGPVTKRKRMRLIELPGINNDLRRCESVGCRFGMGSTSNNTTARSGNTMSIVASQIAHKSASLTRHFFIGKICVLFRDSTKAGTP